MADTEKKKMASMSCTIRHERPVDDLTKGWTDEEKAKLAAGDMEAGEALADALTESGYSRGFDYMETDDFEVFDKEVAPGE